MAYAAARRYAHDPRFTFGTWKIEVLGGFASALLLMGVAAAMGVASVERIFRPRTIRSQEAMAVLGLLVNIVCALILGKANHYGHGATHRHARGHGAHDHHHQMPANDDLRADSHSVLHHFRGRQHYPAREPRGRHGFVTLERCDG